MVKIIFNNDDGLIAFLQKLGDCYAVRYYTDRKRINFASGLVGKPLVFAQFLSQFDQIDLIGLEPVMNSNKGPRFEFITASSQPNIDILTGDRLLHDIGGGLLSAAIASDTIENYEVLLAARKSVLRIQRDACVNALRKHLPDWKFTIPAGGIFL